MKIHINILILAIAASTVFQANAQISVGAGISGLEFISDRKERPLNFGVNARVGINLGDKGRIDLIPTIYFPSEVRFLEEIPGSPPIIVYSTESISLFQASTLFTYSIVGENAGSKIAVYGSLGPSVGVYNAKIVREGYGELDVESGFSDLLADLRVGGELELMVVRLFSELSYGMILATNLEENPDYTPNRGSLFAGSIGIRIPLGE